MFIFLISSNSRKYQFLLYNTDVILVQLFNSNIMKQNLFIWPYNHDNYMYLDLYLRGQCSYIIRYLLLFMVESFLHWYFFCSRVTSRRVSTNASVSYAEHILLQSRLWPGNYQACSQSHVTPATASTGHQLITVVRQRSALAISSLLWSVCAAVAADLMWTAPSLTLTNS